MDHDTDIKFLKEMGQPKGDGGDGAGLLDSLKDMINKLRDELTDKIDTDLGNLKDNLSSEIDGLKDGHKDLEEKLRQLEAATTIKDDE